MIRNEQIRNIRINQRIVSKWKTNKQQQNKIEMEIKNNKNNLIIKDWKMNEWKNKKMMITKKE